LLYYTQRPFSGGTDSGGQVNSYRENMVTIILNDIGQMPEKPLGDEM